jgi:hypothetical protein
MSGSSSCWGPGVLMMAAVPLLAVLGLVVCLGLCLHRDLGA